MSLGIDWKFNDQGLPDLQSCGVCRQDQNELSREDADLKRLTKDAGFRVGGSHASFADDCDNGMTTATHASWVPGYLMLQISNMELAACGSKDGVFGLIESRLPAPGVGQAAPPTGEDDP